MVGSDGCLTRRLAWYRSPGEFLRGHPALGVVDLNAVTTEIVPFITKRARLALTCPFGFEMSEKNKKGSTFLCGSSRQDMTNWIDILKSDQAANVVPLALDPEPEAKPTDMVTVQTSGLVIEVTEPVNSSTPVNVGIPELFEARSPTHSDAGSEEGSDADSEEDDNPDLAIRRLGQLVHRVESSISMLNSTLDTTTKECRHLLSYFDQKVYEESPALLAKNVQSFMETLRDFCKLFKRALTDITKSRQALSKKGLIDPIAAMRELGCQEGPDPTRQAGANSFNSVESEAPTLA
jgi:hypothetical protein